MPSKREKRAIICAVNSGPHYTITQSLSSTLRQWTMRGVNQGTLSPPPQHPFLQKVVTVLTERLQRENYRGSFWEIFPFQANGAIKLQLSLPLWIRTRYLELQHPSCNYEGTISEKENHRAATLTSLSPWIYTSSQLPPDHLLWKQSIWVASITNVLTFLAAKIIPN